MASELQESAPAAPFFSSRSVTSQLSTTLYWPISASLEVFLNLFFRTVWTRVAGTGIVANRMSRARRARAQPG